MTKNQINILNSIAGRAECYIHPAERALVKAAAQICLKTLHYKLHADDYGFTFIIDRTFYSCGESPKERLGYDDLEILAKKGTLR